MRELAVLSLAVLLLGGCAAPSSKTGAAGPSATAAMDEHMGHDAGGHILAPTLKVGDWWTMDSPQADGGRGGSFTYAISGESGDDWIVDTDSRDTAFFNALNDVSFLGPMRKADLAGSQGSTRVEFLHFPLTSHMNWTTTWDGQPMMLHVMDVSNGRATVQAMRSSGVRYAEYTYDSNAHYFSHFAFYDGAGKDVAFEQTLRQSGGAYAGTLVRWAVQEVYGLSVALGQAQAPASGTFTVQPGSTDLWVTVDIECSAGMFEMAVGPPTGPATNRGAAANGPCPVSKHDAYSLPSPTEAEQWGSFYTSAPQATTGTIDVHVYARTATEFMAGKAPAT